MTRTIKTLIAALGLFALCVAGASAAPQPADHHDVPSGPPRISNLSAGNVSETTATLKANVDPNHRDGSFAVGTTNYHFEIGPTSTYGVTTPNGTLQWWQGDTPVSGPISGLTPGTTYHYRVVATNNRGASSSADKTFQTTGKAPSSGPGKPAPSGSGKGPGGKGAEPKVEGEPELGHSVAAAVSKGTVRVRVQGSDEFRDIAPGEAIPLNSTFDTISGTVLLEAAGSDGKTYTGAFHGGQFTVHQSAKGATTLEMEGGDFSACGTSRMGRATASSAHPVLRKLWGKDHGGRFKTSSRGSVATVRGTEWLTADRCDGTLTRVTKGKVLVRERGTGRSKLLHKGESFFAHAPH
jgi:hypothetical protein